MKKSVLFICILSMFFITKAYPQSVGTLLSAFNNAKVESSSDVMVILESARYKKIRGARVGGSSWDNEQWGSSVELKNILPYMVSGTLNMKVLDGDGFVLDDYLLYAGAIAPGDVIKFQTQLFIKTAHIKNIRSAILHFNFIRK